jgi:hypothetical protein
MSAVVLYRKGSLRMITCLIDIVIAICLFASTVDGYASWLKCFVDFDPEEIVMHHPMTLPQDSPHHVVLEVQPYGETTWIVAEEYTLPGKHYDSEGEPAGDKDSQAPTSTTSTVTKHTLKVRLRVPHALELEEVQYVVQVKGNGAVFMDLGVMCDGVRAFSRSYNEHVVLSINLTSSTGSNSTDHDDDDIELLAGWASGYGPVALTRTMRIKRNIVHSNGRDEL